MRPKKFDTENYKFVQNRKCEYFPCHKIENDDEFNCMFCFCPLHMLKNKCGGDFKYTNDFKDCSGCIKPHAPGSYEFVMSKMGLVCKIASERD